MSAAVLERRASLLDVSAADLIECDWRAAGAALVCAHTNRMIPDHWAGILYMIIYSMEAQTKRTKKRNLAKQYKTTGEPLL